MSSNGLVQRLWNYCNVLRDDGLSYGDYLEQLTYLLFLKMADEQTKPPFNRPAFIPQGLDWQSLLARDGDELEVHYRHLLSELGRRPGMLGVVFRKAQNRIQDPAKLRRLIVDLIDRESWMTLDADVKGDAYEGLQQRNAEDVKTGAGQYFTPRPLIKAIVEVMRPEPGMTICDPACGTGGFLLAAHEYVSRNHPYLDPDEKRHLRFDALRGVDIVDTVARLCVMNLLLHGIGALRAPRGLRASLQPRRSPRAERERAASPVHLRGAPPAGQGEPRPDLAARRVARGLGEPPAAGRARPGDRGGSRGGLVGVLCDRREPALGGRRAARVTASRSEPRSCVQ